jgi:glycosyltransferase involved in cell wall biosynthesis
MAPSSNFLAHLRYWRNSLSELLKYSRCIMEFGAFLHFARAIMSFTLTKRLESLIRSYSLAQSSFMVCVLSRILSHYLPPISPSFSPTTLWETHQIGWKRYQSQLDYSPAASRTLILKAPQANGEKGVIISCFEYNWLRILSGIEPFDDFDAHYTLILSTTSSPTNYNMLALALEKIKGPVFVIPCNVRDIPKLKKIHPRIQPLDMLACDWLNPAHFAPKPWLDRNIDILLVSNWAPVKRHWHFFDILRQLPASLKVVCIGQPEGSFTLEHIRELQKKHGAPQNIDFLERIPIEEVNELQCNSKIAIILSRREGCCVAAVEGLMAGAWLAMLENAYVGPLDYINKGTGARLNPRTASQQLLGLLRNPPERSPNLWAKSNISCYQSTEKLNGILKTIATQSGQPWTENLTIPCWHPFPCFVDSTDEIKLSPFANALTKSYPSVFPPDWIQNSRF